MECLQKYSKDQSKYWSANDDDDDVDDDVDDDDDDDDDSISNCFTLSTAATVSNGLCIHLESIVSLWSKSSCFASYLCSYGHRALRPLTRRVGVSSTLNSC